MDIDVIAASICSGLATAEAMIVASGAPYYERYRGRDRLQSVNFRAPYEPVQQDLVACQHEHEHDLVEIGLEDRVPEYYATSNLYVATQDVAAYDIDGISISTIYTLDLYLWREQEHPGSVERKLVVVGSQILRALRAAPVQWEMHPQQVDWALGTNRGPRETGESGAADYRMMRYSISVTHVELE